MRRHGPGVTRATVCLAVWLAACAAVAGQQADEAITVCAVGDINMGTAFPSEEYLPPDGGRGLFAPVQDLLAGDIVFGNLEGPLADGGETTKCSSPRGCFAFRTPTGYVEHLQAAGFHVLSLANNHAMDFGKAGRASTIEALDAAGIAHSGPPGDVATLEVRGKSVALIAFAPYDHSHNLLEVEAAAALVRELDRRHDLILVSFHGGTEGSRATRVPDEMEHLGSEPRGHLIQFAHAVVDAGADLVLGHGPHVLRGMEVYRRRLIVYSLGNFCTYARFSLSGALGRAIVLRVRLDPDTGAFHGGRMDATVQTKPGGPRPDDTGRGIALVRKLSQQDFPFTRPRFGKQGRIQPPPGDGAGLLALATPDDRAAVAGLLAWLVRQGLPRAALLRWFGDRRAALLPEVIERFDRPAERMPYKKYRAIFVKKKVIEAGKRFMEEKKSLLDQVEKRFGVDRQALTGLIATETRFGTHRGEYATFNALATVSLKYQRRARWARRELEALLRVFGDDPLAVKGSYAGAVGLVQFMPTSIRSYGVDFDGDGRVDLDGWQDALASAANYLARHGWVHGEPIRRGKANYRALFRYNPSHHYARVIKELAERFGHPRPGRPPRQQDGRDRNEAPDEKKPAPASGGPPADEAGPDGATG